MIIAKFLRFSIRKRIPCMKVSFKIKKLVKKLIEKKIRYSPKITDFEFGRGARAPRRGVLGLI